MTDIPRTPETATAASDEAGIPRWVKLSGVAVLAVLLVVAVVMLVSGGKHGPGRHTGSSNNGEHSAPSGFPEDHVPPKGAH